MKMKHIVILILVFSVLGCGSAVERNFEELKKEHNLESYDCKKLLLDASEDCIFKFKCRYDYYEESDEILMDYYLHKECWKIELSFLNK